MTYEYRVEVGRNRGSYKLRFRLLTSEAPMRENGAIVRLPAQVSIQYHGINISNGYKKRLRVTSTGFQRGTNGMEAIGTSETVLREKS